MARYSTFKYGAQKYGATAPANLIWALEVDWDDNGAFSGAIEAGRVVGISIERGRNYLISPGGDGFNPMQSGRMRVMLENHDGRYDAFNAGSPLYPNVKPGLFAQLPVRAGANSYYLFNGTVQDIRPSRKTQLAALEVEDGLRWLMDETATTPIYQNIYADDGINAVLDRVQWPALWARNIAGGADVLDYWWAKGRSGLEEIRGLADSEIGHFFHAANGEFVFRSRHSSQSAAVSVDQSQVSTDLETPQPWDVRKNVVRVTANVISAAVETIVWTAPPEIAVGPGASVELFATLTGGVIDLVEPAATTDYTAFSQSDGAGANLTSSITIALEVFAESVKVTVENAGSQLAYINFLQLRGKPLASVPVISQASTPARRPQVLQLDLEWQQDMNNPGSFAARLLAFLAGSGPLPELVIDNRPEIQFAVDLFDLVNVDIAALGINATYRVGAIRHNWRTANGQAVQTTWKLEPYQSYDYWRFPVIFNTTSILGW